NRPRGSARKSPPSRRRPSALRSATCPACSVFYPDTRRYMEATSIEGLVAHCQSGKFTGILRMRAREGIGEVWFLSGFADEMQFGTSRADEAMDRMRKATDAT